MRQSIFTLESSCTKKLVGPMLGLWLCCVSPDIKHQCQGILMKSSVRHHWSSSTSALSKDKVGHREWSFTASFRGDNLHFIYGHFARHPSMVSCELCRLASWISILVFVLSFKIFKNYIGKMNTHTHLCSGS